MKEEIMTEFSLGSARRVARQIIDMGDDKRKAILKTFPSEMKCRVVEEMVNIRLSRLKGPDGKISPMKVSDR